MSDTEQYSIGLISRVVKTKLQQIPSPSYGRHTAWDHMARFFVDDPPSLDAFEKSANGNIIRIISWNLNFQGNVCGFIAKTSREVQFILSKCGVNRSKQYVFTQFPNKYTGTNEYSYVHLVGFLNEFLKGKEMFPLNLEGLKFIGEEVLDQMLLQEEMKNLKQKLETLKEELRTEFVTMLQFAPEGECVGEAKEHFTQLQKTPDDDDDSANT